MDIQLQPLGDGQTSAFKEDMQRAFQQDPVASLVLGEAEILPESHIDRSLSTPGAIAYAAMSDTGLVGGAIVVINPDTQRNLLDFLYVKDGEQNKGVGRAIWNAIEALHPDTKVWETYTPYFDKRNIHFYVNKCGFHVVEFFNKSHPGPHFLEETHDLPAGADRDYFSAMLRFEKEMPVRPCCHGA